MEFHTATFENDTDLIKKISHLLPKWKWYVFHEWAEVSGYVGIDNKGKLGLPITAMGGKIVVHVRTTGWVQDCSNELPIIIHTHPAYGKNGASNTVGFHPPSVVDIREGILYGVGMQLVCEKGGVWVITSKGPPLSLENEKKYDALVSRCHHDDIGRLSFSIFANALCDAFTVKFCCWETVKTVAQTFPGESIGVGGAEDNCYEPVVASPDAPPMTCTTVSRVNLRKKDFNDGLLSPHFNEWGDLIRCNAGIMYGVLSGDNAEYVRMDACMQGMVNVVIMPYHDRGQVIRMDILEELANTERYAIIVYRYGIWMLNVGKNWDSFLRYYGMSCGDWAIKHVYRKTICRQLNWNSNGWEVQLYSWGDLESCLWTCGKW